MSVFITVADVKQPAPGRKFGSVYDTQGQRWSCPPEFLNSFVNGGSYNISYDQKSYNGKPYNQIKSVTNAPIGGAPTPAAQPARTSVANPNPEASDRLRRLDIFICGAINNMLSNQNVNPMLINAEELSSWINVMKTVWAKSLSDPFSLPRPAAQPVPQQAAPAATDDMSDEIPF